MSNVSRVFIRSVFKSVFVYLIIVVDFSRFCINKVLGTY